MKSRCFNTHSSLDSQCSNLSKRCKWTAARRAAPRSWRRAVWRCRRFSWSWRRSDSFGCRILSWLPSHPETEWHPEVEVSTWKQVKGARLVQEPLNTTAIYKKAPDSPPPAEGTEAFRGQWSPTIREFLWHCGGLCTEVALDFFIVGHFDWRGIKKIPSQSIFTSHFHFLNDKEDIFNIISFSFIFSPKLVEQIQTVSSKLIFRFFSTHKWQKKTDCGFSS